MRKIEDEEKQGFKLDLTEYVRVLWRKKHLIVIPLFFSALVAFVGVRFLPPVYQSSIVLQIENPDWMNPEVQRLVQPDQRREREVEIRAKVETNITSSDFLDRLSILLGFDQDPDVIRQAELSRASSHPDVSVEQLVFKRLRDLIRGRIEVQRVGPGLFEISYLDANPEACYVIVDAMTKLYIEEQQRLQLMRLRVVSDFSDEQLIVYRERLDKSERELDQFQQEMARTIVASNPVVETNIGVARSLEGHLAVEIDDLTRVVDNLEGRLITHVGGVPDYEMILGDKEVQNLRSELIAHVTSQLLSQLQAGGSETQTPSLTSQQEIARVQQDVLARLQELIREHYRGIDQDYRPLIDEYLYQVIQLATRERKMEKLQEYIGTYKRNVELGPQMETELQRLTAEVEQNRALYEQFLEAKTSTQITEAAQNSDLATSMAIVESATFPLRPVRPEKAKILVLAVVFGLTIGGLGLVLSEFTDTSFKTVDEVEKRLGLRVLGTVPRIETTGSGWRRENRVRRVLIWATTSILLTAVSIFAFYFYGKSTKENLVSFQMTNTQQSVGGQR
jgi:uncharacterized protein involved in exopolysaccharide biosynthesis